MGPVGSGCMATMRARGWTARGCVCVRPVSGWTYRAQICVGIGSGQTSELGRGRHGWIWDCPRALARQFYPFNLNKLERTKWGRALELALAQISNHRVFHPQHKSMQRNKVPCAFLYIYLQNKIKELNLEKIGFLLPPQVPRDALEKNNAAK